MNYQNITVAHEVSAARKRGKEAIIFRNMQVSMSFF